MQSKMIPREQKSIDVLQRDFEDPIKREQTVKLSGDTTNHANKIDELNHTMISDSSSLTPRH